MPPEHVEEASEQSKNRVEQLANSFASAVLMPASVLDRFGPWDKDIVRRLNAAANALEVTATALKWRLIALGRLDRADGQAGDRCGAAQQWTPSSERTVPHRRCSRNRSSR